MAGTARAALPNASLATLEQARADLDVSFVERGNHHIRARALALPILGGAAARLDDGETASRWLSRRSKPPGLSAPSV